MKMNKYPSILADKSDSCFFTNYRFSFCLVFLPLTKLKPSIIELSPFFNSIQPSPEENPSSLNPP